MLAVVVAALATGLNLLVAAHLITAGHFGDAWAVDGVWAVIWVFFDGLGLTVTWLYVRGLLVNRRKAKALARRDPAVVADATPQPSSDPLAAGEMLTLTYGRSLNAIFHSLLALVYMSMVAIGGEQIVFHALPSLQRIAPNVSYILPLAVPSAPPPTALDWITAALPILFTVTFFGLFIWYDLRDRVHQVVADDEGITVRDGLGRHHLRWGDVDLFMRVSERGRAEPVGTYLLWSQTQSLNFPIAGISSIIDREVSQVSRPDLNTFAGGYSTYVHDAQRLLATIVARTQLPLLTLRAKPRRQQRRMKLLDVSRVTEAEALALPLAGQRYTPSEYLLDMQLAEGETLALRGQSGPYTIAPNGMNDLMMLVLVVPLASSAVLFRLPLPFALAGGAVIVLLIGIYIELMRRTNRVKAQPDVRADETGLTTWGYFRDQPLTLPWQRIAAWALIPPTKPSGNIHYVVFGDGLQLTWVEPSYGPYGWSGVWSTSPSAYKKRAEQLHALIVARTGQPLRELRLDAGPAQQSANR